MSVRKIVKIDEEKCNGCGLCVPSCAEGAIQVINGKARLVKEQYCDGLGACLGECPQDAITIEERNVADFDAHAAEKHIEELKKKEVEKKLAEKKASPQLHACPGSALRAFKPSEPAVKANETASSPSQLSTWPVQLKLVPVTAPYLNNADILIAADCVPFAFADFHSKFLAGKTLIIGCPKLDDVSYYFDKLTDIFKVNNVNSVEVAYMEVPCCFGLVQTVRNAIEASGKDIPLMLTKIGIRGGIVESTRQINQSQI
jgi:Pyruvate/2-oxoacid:ferredoxin oxidoreductase delta subunit